MSSPLPRWWHPLDDGRLQCDLCPRHCRLRAGQRGFCFVRKNEGGQILLETYGKSTGFCIDPIEKKPLNHFYPSSSVLSFGTAGCNLGCRFCQNWEVSKAREVATRSQAASPEAIAQTAADNGCTSVAFTYNDPVIFAEYAIDTAHACHDLGIKTVAVTAGYIDPGPRETFFAVMDAANVDLKAFNDDFYRRLCFGKLDPVLETLAWLGKNPQTWLEITTLLIPGENDSTTELGRLFDWVLEHLGALTPLHLTAFHPDFKLTALGATPAQTLMDARSQAIAAGLKHVYTGNVRDSQGQSSYCAHCGARAIERSGYQISAYNLDPRGQCVACGHALEGRFSDAPGTWGEGRKPVRPEG